MRAGGRSLVCWPGQEGVGRVGSHDSSQGCQGSPAATRPPGMAAGTPGCQAAPQLQQLLADQQQWPPVSGAEAPVGWRLVCLPPGARQPGQAGGRRSPPWPPLPPWTAGTGQSLAPAQLDSHSATKTMGDSNFPNRPALGQLNFIRSDRISIH